MDTSHYSHSGFKEALDKAVIEYGVPFQLEETILTGGDLGDGEGNVMRYHIKIKKYGY